MKSLVTTRFLTAALVLAHSVAFVASQAAAATRSYRMGTVGNLEMTVPSTWQDNSITLEKPQGVTLAYRLPSRTDFYMKVTAVWAPPASPGSREAGWVKRTMERAARDLVGASKPPPTLSQITSAGGSGYYFQSPGYNRFPIGEFTYVTEGVLDLGEVTFIFSTYSNTKDLPELAEALRVVESARFVATNT